MARESRDIIRNVLIHVRREILVVGKIGELPDNHLWRNKSWRIAVWSAPHEIKLYNILIVSDEM